MPFLSMALSYFYNVIPDTEEDVLSLPPDDRTPAWATQPVTQSPTLKDINDVQLLRRKKEMLHRMK